MDEHGVGEDGGGGPSSSVDHREVNEASHGADVRVEGASGCGDDAGGPDDGVEDAYHEEVHEDPVEEVGVLRACDGVQVIQD